MAEEINTETGAAAGNDGGAADNTGSAGGGILTGSDPVGQQNNADNGDAGNNGNTQDQQPAGDAEKGQDTDWNLETPDGMDEAYVKELSDGCKKLGMSKEVAKNVLEMRAKEMADWDKTQVQWQREIATDSEFGGQHFGETVALARKALGAFDPDGTVRAMLDKTGYSNNPEVIKLFARAGKAMGEDTMINGRGGAAQKPLADRLYHD